MRIYSFAHGESYHIYNRGVEKRLIFIDQSDYERFIKLLFFCNSLKPVVIRNLRKGLTFAETVDKRGERLVDIGAYCLMPNHFHLLIKEKSEGGVSLFMQKILTAYAMYFNQKYDRKGRLFESSFRSTHVYYDEYLKYLFAYIHLNPLKLIDPKWRENNLYKENQNLRALEGYQFSSMRDYLGIVRDEANLLNREDFPAYFLNAEEFKVYLENWTTQPEVIHNLHQG